MTDPKRLVCGPTDSLDVALLRSARREKPPNRAHERMLSTLGITATAAATMAAAGKASAAIAVANAKPVGAITAAFVAKWAIVGSVGALVTVGLSRQVPLMVGTHFRVPTATSGKVPDKRGLPIGALSAIHDGPDEPLIADTPETAEKGMRSVSGSTKPTPGPKPPAISSLRSEITALDQARAAAVEHDPSRTLALLDAYQRQFPNGALAPEAQLLRVEALIQSGRRARALPLARRLLNAAPDGPLSERLRKLLPEIE